MKLSEATFLDDGSLNFFFFEGTTDQFIIRVDKIARCRIYQL